MHYCNEHTAVLTVDWGLLGMRFWGYVTISARTTFWWCSCSALVSLKNIQKIIIYQNITLHQSKTDITCHINKLLPTWFPVTRLLFSESTNWRLRPILRTWHMSKVHSPVNKLVIMNRFTREIKFEICVMIQIANNFDF